MINYTRCTIEMGDMNMKDSKYFIFLILLGGIGGTIAGNILGTNFQTLGFLKSVYYIGTAKPLVLDLNVLSLTFGISISINIMTIIGIVLAIMLYRKH